MKKKLQFDIFGQPDEVTCGPTCLYSVYQYYGHKIGLHDVVQGVTMLREGGCLAPHLGIHALEQGFEARIYAFNTNIFDPSWFGLNHNALIAKLQKQYAARSDPKLLLATRAYDQFLSRGGQVYFEDLHPRMLSRYLKEEKPVIVGLSSTYLYRSQREIPETMQHDDIAGEPAGHFVVLAGYDEQQQTVAIADPYEANPLAPGMTYEVSIDRLMCSILLGVMTYDANLLILSEAVQGDQERTAGNEADPQK